MTTPEVTNPHDLAVAAWRWAMGQRRESDHVCEPHLYLTSPVRGTEGLVVAYCLHDDEQSALEAASSVLTTVEADDLPLPSWVATVDPAFIARQAADSLEEAVAMGPLEERYRAGDPHVHDVLIVTVMQPQGLSTQAYVQPLLEPMYDRPQDGEHAGRHVDVLVALWWALHAHAEGVEPPAPEGG